MGNTNIILASQSPRRKQLLEDAGIRFELINSIQVEEIIPEGISNEEAAVYLTALQLQNILLINPITKQNLN